MNRKNITVQNAFDEDNYIGWFDLDSSTVLARYQSEGPYVNYVDILQTAGGKLVREDSSTCGEYAHYSACTAKIEKVI